MSPLSRRAFIKTALVAGSAVTMNAHLPMAATGEGLQNTIAKTSNGDATEAFHGEGKKVMTIISDVDAHSQCRLRVGIQGGRLISVDGDPADPEGCGELTLRDRS